MEYVAVAVAIFGVAIGLTSRLRFLLGMVVTVFAMTLIFVLSQPYGGDPEIPAQPILRTTRR